MLPKYNAHLSKMFHKLENKHYNLSFFDHRIKRLSGPLTGEREKLESSSSRKEEDFLDALIERMHWEFRNE